MLKTSLFGPEDSSVESSLEGLSIELSSSSDAEVCTLALCSFYNLADLRTNVKTTLNWLYTERAATRLVSSDSLGHKLSEDTSTVVVRCVLGIQRLIIIWPSVSGQIITKRCMLVVQRLATAFLSSDSLSHKLFEHINAGARRQVLRLP